MNVATRPDLSDIGNLPDLHEWLAKAGMLPGWNKPTPSLWAAPKKTFVPVHFSYLPAKAALDAAGRMINTELAERRNLILFNPAEGNSYGTVRTMVAAYQMLLAGEHARVHRHTPNALRLILDADPGTYTVVDGKRVEMVPGDVLLTPNWSTHGHGNESKSSSYWIDFLDAPLVQLLEPMFFEPEVDDDEQHEAFARNVEPKRDITFAFPFGETLRRLDEAEPDPSGRLGTSIELGHPALDTMALHMMRPGGRTSPLQTTANNIYAVVQGEGVTDVEGERFSWRRGDVIGVPAWRPHFHEAAADAILFRVTDEPTMERLGFLRANDA